MNKVIIFTIILMLSLSAYSQSNISNTEGTTKHIQWTNMTDALSKSKKSRKKILVDFYTDWCGWCKRMDKATYENPKVVEVINKYFIPVKFNAEAEGPIMYKGKNYSLEGQGIRSTHSLAMELLQGQMGYPTTTFLNLDHSKIQSIPGYIDAGEMVIILKYIGGNSHLSMSYEDFKMKESMRPQ